MSAEGRFAATIIVMLVAVGCAAGATNRGNPLGGDGGLGDERGIGGSGVLPAPDTGAADGREGGGQTPEDGVGLCNALSLAGVAPVPEELSTATPPEPMGGTLVAGTYVLWSDTLYGSDPNCTDGVPATQSVIAFHPSGPTQGTIQIVNNVPYANVSVDGPEYAVGVYATMGHSISAMATARASGMNLCVPTSESGKNSDYTATDTTYLVFGKRTACGLDVSEYRRR